MAGGGDGIEIRSTGAWRSAGYCSLAFAAFVAINGVLWAGWFSVAIASGSVWAAFRLLWPRVQAEEGFVTVRNIRTHTFAAADVLSIGTQPSATRRREARSIVNTTSGSTPIWALDHHKLETQRELTDQLRQVV